MEFNYTDIIGLIAAFLTTLSFLPQTIKTIKTGNTDGISFLMYLLFTVGVVFWTIFGYLIEKPVIVVANLFTLILASTVLFIKIKNIKNGTDK